MKKENKLDLILEKYNLEIKELKSTLNELERQFLNTEENSKEYNELLTTLKTNINKYYYLISLRNAKREIEDIKRIYQQKLNQI